ncbi:hypothetical protein EII13_05570 [Buchananella hordeovulneris]|nr:hypothetical protein EII13_05570 [Buchananella hordeovulneris]
MAARSARSRRRGRQARSRAGPPPAPQLPRPGPLPGARTPDHPPLGRSARQIRRPGAYDSPCP